MAEGGGQRPPAEYRSPMRKADGGLVRRDDPDRPPTAFTRLKESVSTAIDRFNEGFDRKLDGIFGGKKQSGGRPAGPMMRPPQATEAMKAEIAGETQPGTEEKPIYDWKRDDEEVASNPIVTPVTELANTHTMGELADVMKMRRPAIPTDGGDPVEIPKRPRLDEGGAEAPRWNKDVLDLFAPTPPRSQEEEEALERSKGHHPAGGGVVEQQSSTPRLKLVTDPKPDQPPTPPTPPEGPSAA